MKAFDCCVIVQSAIDASNYQSDQEFAIALVLSTLYMRFFSGRTYELRGDA